MTTEQLRAGGPRWLSVVAALGVLWNAYGTYQFIGSFSQTKSGLMTAGMANIQAELYLSLPTWISLVFAVGVFGGLAGSAMLFMKKAIALPISAASFVGYILLFTGDYCYGVFANIPTKLAILAAVVAIAAVLLVATLYAKNRRFLA